MVQIIADNSQQRTLDGAEPRLWSLTARQLHDAYWHAHGVQCVRLGQKQPIQRAAELYLLVDADQLVLFPLGELTSRLTWHNALVTRMRLVDESSDRYSERVELDEDGCVQRIGRRYRPRHQGSAQLVLTRSRRLAVLWMNAVTRRVGWVRVRRAVPWSRIDHWRCTGKVYASRRVKDHRALIDELVQRWANPAQAIAGVEELEPGVWGPVDQPLSRQTIRIGPVWLGVDAPRPQHERNARCLVGPTWVSDHLVTHPDRERPAPVAIEVKLIAEVEEDQVQAHGQSVPRSRRVVYQMIKRILDVGVSAVALLVMLPVMFLIGLLILLEDGRPVFFGHWRQGRGGRLFTCWKFRSMIRNAEQVAHELEQYNSCDGPQVFIQDDPRVTRMGRILRPSHLDELPQLWNVLVGQMSLVGPRPSPDGENQFCPAWRDIRLSVRPGITGLWQLNRRREPGEDFQEWIRYDIRYVRRAGLRMDFKILVKTAWVMIFGRGDSAVQ